MGSGKCRSTSLVEFNLPIQSTSKKLYAIHFKVAQARVVAYKECCNLVDRKRQEFAMEGSTQYRAIPKGRGFVYMRTTVNCTDK